MPDVLRRLVASTLCLQYRTASSVAEASEAVAVGVPAATAVVAKTVQVHAERHAGPVVDRKQDSFNPWCTCAVEVDVRKG